MSLLLWVCGINKNTCDIAYILFQYKIILCDTRLDESKLILTFVIGGLGIFIYLFNISEWANFAITKLQNGIVKNTFKIITPICLGNSSKKITTNKDEKNSLLVYHRRREISPENRLEIHDNILNDEAKTEHQNPYRDYNRGVNVNRILASHYIPKKQNNGCLLILFVFTVILCLGVIFWHLYDFPNLFKAIQTGIAAFLTLNPPQGPSTKWLQPLITIPLVTLAHILFFATITQFCQNFFEFMAKHYYRHGIKT